MDQDVIFSVRVKTAHTTQEIESMIRERLVRYDKKNFGAWLCCCRAVAARLRCSVWFDVSERSGGGNNITAVFL